MGKKSGFACLCPAFSGCEIRIAPDVFGYEKRHAGSAIGMLWIRGCGEIRIGVRILGAVGRIRMSLREDPDMEKSGFIRMVLDTNSNTPGAQS